jgi:putative transposase
MKRPVTALCRAAGLSRQAYYQGQRERCRSAVEEERIIEAVRRVRRTQPRVGGRKLQCHLQAEGLAVGRDTLFGVLRAHGQLVPPKKKAVRTTYYDASLPVYRNRLYEFTPTQPHEVWVSDVTYLRVDDDAFVYLSLITDLVSRCIVGWYVSATNTAADCLQALLMAVAQLPAGYRPIHHSDRGSQYCSHEYVAALNHHGLEVSMTEQNHCYENCHAERVNGILKDEFHLDATFRSLAQARTAIAQAIATYNHHRLHTSLAMRTPSQVHRLAA